MLIHATTWRDVLKRKSSRDNGRCSIAEDL